MSDCCDPISYRRFFNSKEARRRLRKYRKRGLDSMAQSLVDYLTTRDIDGADLLEVGGGVGDLQVELLRAGLGKAVNVELSAGYEETATDLMKAEGLEARISRHIGDFVEEQHRFDPADVVVLNRVVCCYPWMERMMEAAVGKARSCLALTFPREKWWMRAVIGIGNSWNAVRRCAFRGFVHPVSGIESVATDAGFQIAYRDHSLGWQAIVFERA